MLSKILDCVSTQVIVYCWQGYLERFSGKHRVRIRPYRKSSCFEVGADALGMFKQESQVGRGTA